MSERERVGWGGLRAVRGGAVASVPAHSAVTVAVAFANSAILSPVTITVQRTETAIPSPPYSSNPSSNLNVPLRCTTSPSTSIRESSLTSVIMSTWTAESLASSSLPSGKFDS